MAAMPEHRIRLRGAWVWAATDQAGPPTRRIDLPLTALGDLPPRFRLARKFGRPPFDPASQSLRLELADVPGLVAVALNGESLPRSSSAEGDWSIPLDDPLPPRNTLTLDVDLGSVAALEGPWGSIALVVEAKGDRGGPSRYNGGPSGSAAGRNVEAG